MNVTLAAADFGAYYTGAATLQFTVADFANNGHGTATALSFRLDATAGSFAQSALYFTLQTAGSRLCEGYAMCAPGSPTVTPIQGPFVGPPTQGNYLGNVQWDGVNGTISVAWTWLK